MKSIVLASLLAAGCADPITNHYNIWVDPNLSGGYQAAVAQAAYSWVDILDGYLYIGWLGSSTCSTSETGNICIHASTRAEITSLGGSPGEIGFTIHHNYIDSADIYLPVDVDNPNDAVGLQQVLGHELGHAFGEKHTQPGTLLCYNSSCAALVPTCPDANQFLAIRGAFGDWTTWPGNRFCPHGGNYYLTGQ